MKQRNVLLSTNKILLFWLRVLHYAVHLNVGMTLSVKSVSTNSSHLISICKNYTWYVKKVLYKTAVSPFYTWTRYIIMTYFFLQMLHAIYQSIIHLLPYFIFYFKNIVLICDFHTDSMNELIFTKINCQENLWYVIWICWHKRRS